MMSEYIYDTAEYIFKCETTKLKLAKNIKKRIFERKKFLYDVMFYQILMLFKFLEISYVLLLKRSYGITKSKSSTSSFVVPAMPETHLIKISQFLKAT